MSNVKINNVPRVTPANLYQKQQDVKNEEIRNRVKANQDQVQISDEAKELASAATSPRAEKLAQLKGSVADGTYQVDAHQLAEKLLKALRF